VEHAVHFFDMTGSFTDGQPVSVTGSSHCRVDGREDQVMATVIYDNGMMATHYHDFSRPGFFEKTSIRLVFALAEIEIEGWIPLSGRMRCLCTPETEVGLSRLPGWSKVSKLSVRDIEDISRPEGWGEVGQGEKESQVVVMDGEQAIGIETMIVGNFAAGGTKGEVYIDSLRALQSDFLMSIEDSDHTPGVRLEDGRKSLEIALRADQSAHRSDP
jgi:predicted dehydrogenase